MAAQHDTAFGQHFPLIGQPIPPPGGATEPAFGTTDTNTLMRLHYNIPDPASFRARVTLYSKFKHPFARVFRVTWSNNDPTTNVMPDLRPEARAHARAVLQQAGGFFTCMLRFVAENINTLSALNDTVVQSVQNDHNVRRALPGVLATRDYLFDLPTRKMVAAASLLDAAMLQRVTAGAAAGADTWEQIFACVEGFGAVYRAPENRELYGALVRVREAMDAFALLQRYFGLVDDVSNAVGNAAALVGQLEGRCGLQAELSQMVWWGV